MRSLARVQTPSGSSRDRPAKPFVCLAMALVLVAVFWTGMIWLAQRTAGVADDQGVNGQMSQAQHDGARVLQAALDPASR